MAAAICVVAANANTDDRSDYLFSAGYFLLGCAFAAMLCMLLANWLGWSDEEIEQGFQGRK